MCVCVCVSVWVRACVRVCERERERERERVNEAVKISGLSLVIEKFQPGLMPSTVTQVLSGNLVTTGEADHP